MSRFFGNSLKAKADGHFAGKIRISGLFLLKLSILQSLRLKQIGGGDSQDAADILRQ